jgi:hypothetical protein
MYPVVLRALWLDAQIRNGSGNGGGILVGMMPQVNDSSHQYYSSSNLLLAQTTYDKLEREEAEGYRCMGSFSS